MEATRLRIYNEQETSWVLTLMQISALLSIFENPGKSAGTTEEASPGLTQIRTGGKFTLTVLNLLLAVVQMELKCY